MVFDAIYLGYHPIEWKKTWKILFKKRKMRLSIDLILQSHQVSKLYGQSSKKSCD